MVGQGFGAVGHGLGALGQFGRNFVGDVTHGIDGAVKRVDGTVEAANEGYGFTMSDSAFNSPRPQSGAWNEYPTISVTDETSGDQERPTQTIRNSLGGDRPSVEKGRGLRKPHDVAVLDRAPASLPEERPVDGVYDEKARSHESSRSSADSRPKGGLALPEASPDHARPWQFWKRHESVMPFPSPQPHTAEEEEYPLGPMGTAKSPTSAQPDQRIAKSKWAEAFSKMQFWNKGDDEKEETEYPKAFNEEFLNDDDDDEDAAWKKYIEPKDRDTLREPIVHKDWFPRLPLMGKKIDKIHWLRKELARLNVEIEQDQKEPEKFPLMNSAFIQFNHQVAAHMACQSLSHHVPQHMAPRLVEISPSDVIWDNMSIKWWERYVRIAIVIVICVALIILYGIPVVFTGLLSQIGYLADTYKWLAWLADLPNVAISIIQGVLPAVLLSALLTLVPIIFRLLVKQQGHHHDTDMSARTHHESAGSWKDTDRWRKAVNVPIRQPVNAVNAIRRIGQRQRRHSGSEIPEHQHTVESDGPPASGEKKPTAKDVDPQKKTVDIESQRTVGDVLFSGFSDELEDLTPDERDLLVRYAFQHSALRARRPVVWIPRDHLGVSDDEIKRTKRFSTVTYEADEDNREQITGDASEKVEGGVKKTNIWISNEGTALDAKGKVVFRRSPPDFANVDLIEL
ncbi:hypothetical protein M8818_006509 [Zalaria obscura]|uniref:Uncharacterized protein n=1 Tax=Zalaria obscura TaxID=2024903 RepID=A0ACC3S708_9PEZI